MSHESPIRPELPSFKLLRSNLAILDAHLAVDKDCRFSAAVEIFQCDLPGGLADQARTKVSTE
jgi:hypothetical protein